MKKHVLIISTSETFTVKGLESKLSEIGITSDYVTTKIEKIEYYLKRVEFIVYYLDETSGKVPEVPIFINESCTELDMKMVVIGNPLEYDAVSKFLDPKNVVECFERPLNMAKFLACVHMHLENASLEAQKKSILIVDDDVAYMQMVRKWLKDDYRVGMANSGVQAITWLAGARDAPHRGGDQLYTGHVSDGQGRQDQHTEGALPASGRLPFKNHRKARAFREAEGVLPEAGDGTEGVRGLTFVQASLAKN